jgi:hypothetical protein
MNTIANTIQRLRLASINELKTIRLEYESYLAGLSPDEQADAREQMRPVLKQLTEQAVERMETVASNFRDTKPNNLSAKRL